MNLIYQFEELSQNKNWEEALPIAKKIVESETSIDTSWFNYGVCLEELGQHPLACDAFMKAHELNTLDSGIHY